MNTLKQELRMWWAEKLLHWAMTLAMKTKTEDGDLLVIKGWEYLKGNTISKSVEEGDNRVISFRNPVFIPCVDITKIEKELKANHFMVVIRKNIDHGVQLRLANGEIVNVYSRGKVLIQGKKNEKLNQLFN